MMNKKGLLMEFLSSSALILVLAIVLVIGFIGYTAFNNSIQADDSIQDASKDIINTQKEKYDAAGDNLFIGILISVLIMGVVIAFFTDVHPLIWVFLIIFIVIMLILPAMYSNVWEEFKSDATIEAIAVDHPVQNWVMDNYLLVWIGYITIWIVTAFSKRFYA